MNLVLELLSRIRDTDFQKYLEILDLFEIAFIDNCDFHSAALIHEIKAAEKGGKIAF